MATRIVVRLLLLCLLVIAFAPPRTARAGPHIEETDEDEEEEEVEAGHHHHDNEEEAEEAENEEEEAEEVEADGEGDDEEGNNDNSSGSDEDDTTAGDDEEEEEEEKEDEVEEEEEIDVELAELSEEEEGEEEEEQKKAIDHTDLAHLEALHVDLHDPQDETLAHGHWDPHPEMEHGLTLAERVLVGICPLLPDKVINVASVIAKAWKNRKELAGLAGLQLSGLAIHRVIKASGGVFRDFEHHARDENVFEHFKLLKRYIHLCNLLNTHVAEASEEAQAEMKAMKMSEAIQRLDVLFAEYELDEDEWKELREISAGIETASQQVLDGAEKVTNWMGQKRVKNPEEVDITDIREAEAKLHAKFEELGERGTRIEHDLAKVAQGLYGQHIAPRLTELYGESFGDEEDQE